MFSIMPLTVNDNNNKNINNNIISETSFKMNNNNNNNINNNNNSNNTNHNSNNKNNGGSSSTIASHDESSSSHNSCQSHQMPGSFMTSAVGVDVGISHSYSKRGIIIDLLIILIIILPIIIFEYVIEPFERGFFCNDESISYPYYNDTISTLNLGLFIIIVPSCIMLIVEYLNHRQHDTIWQQITRNIPVMCRCLPNYLVECMRHFAYYIFGLLLTLNFTEIGKFTIGRLRPHFYAVCQPRMLDGSSCVDVFNKQRYIEHYYCQSSLDMGSKFTSADLREAHLSFPSGHSSLIWYSMLYLVIYLQFRIPKYGFSHLALCLVQFLFMIVAWYTALTRIMDNFHHWSDVLIGGILGSIVALLTAYYVAKFGRIEKSRRHVNIQQTPSPFILREVSVVTST